MSAMAILFWELGAILAATFCVCSLVILTQRWHGTLSLDHDLLGVQKIHSKPVPRIGGMGVVVGLLMGVLVGYLMGSKTYPMAVSLLAAAATVFVAGLAEDLTKRVTVRTRLYASFASAGLAVFTAGAQLNRLDIMGIDYLMVMAPFAILFTCFAVGGMTQAINIIDGLNGLASGTVVLMLSGLAIIAWQTNDMLVLKLCLWGIAAMSGFFLLNYPFGRIFLGDGGAYVAGFWVAECGVLLLARNQEVSTWGVLLCCFYPVWETIFSIYRRHVVGRVSSGAPDMRHLHHLIFKRMASSGLVPAVPTWLRHGASSAILWLMVLACQLGASAFYKDTTALVYIFIVMALTYSRGYRFLTAIRSNEVVRDKGQMTIGGH